MGNVGVMAQPPGGYGWPSPTDLIEVTDEAGYFEFVELSPGRYELLVVHPGFVRIELAVDLKRGESVTGIQFLLERGSRISGRVVDAYEVPMERVQIQLTKWPSRYNTVNSGSTGADGSYSLTGLGPGKYILHVATRPKDGFPMKDRKEFTLVLPDGEVSRSVDVRFPWAMKDAVCRVSGIVKSGNRPVAEAALELSKDEPWGHLEVKTDKEGRYITPQLLPGDYVVQVANCRMKLSVPEAETHRFDIEIPSSAISGQVYDRITGKPIEDVRVVLWILPGSDLIESVETNAAGQFAFPGITPGRYYLEIESDDYVNIDLLDLTVGDAGESRECRIPLSRGGSFLGRIIDPDGVPLRAGIGWMVFKWENDERSIDGSGEWLLKKGRFQLDGLPPGEISVIVCSRNSAPSLASRITIVEGSKTEHVFSLGKGGSLHATVTDGNGQPVPDAHFTMFYPSGEWLCLCQNGYFGSLDMNHDGEGDTDGIIQIGRLPAGTLRIKVAQWGFESTWADITIEEGRTTKHLISLAREKGKAPLGR